MCIYYFQKKSHAHTDFTFHSIQTQVHTRFLRLFSVTHTHTHTHARAQTLTQPILRQERDLFVTNRLSGMHQRLHDQSTWRAGRQAGASSHMRTAKAMKNQVRKDRKRRNETGQFKTVNQGRKKQKNCDKHEFSDSCTSLA